MTLSANQKQSGISYFKGLDVLRFIAATVVIFHHTTDLLFKKGFETKAESYFRFAGAFSLDVFFVISGFLISLILMKEFQQGTFTVKNFYLRRIIRIWPLYFLVVLVKVIIIPLMGNYTWQQIQNNVLYACTFMVNYQLLFADTSKAYVVLWSVCIEEHIYLLLPLFLFVFKAKFKIIGWVLTLCGFFSWLYFKNIPSPTGYNTPYFVTFTYFYFFGLGMLLAYFYYKGYKFNIMTLPIIQLFCFVVLVLVIFNVIPYNYSPAKMLFLYGFFASYLVWTAARERSLTYLKPAFTRYLGNISYGMYMIHIMIVIGCIKYFKHSDLKFSETLCGWIMPSVATLITIGFATLLYYCFERPILKLKQRFTTVKSKLI